MKPEDKISVLGEYLRDRAPSSDEEKAALDHVWENLRAEADRVPLEVLHDFQPVHPAPRFRNSQRIAAAVIFISCAVLSIMFVRNRQQSAPAAAVVETASGTLHLTQPLAFGEIVRSDAGARPELALKDGSRVEMHSSSELVLEAAGDGIRIRLFAGSIIVTAAKQGMGHLYVRTKDVTVSVIGTVFLVSVEESGSRVAVIQGKVHVAQEGSASKDLQPGEQVSTASSMAVLSVAENIAWSRQAAGYVALLNRPESLQPAHPTATPEAAGTRRSAPRKTVDATRKQPDSATQPSVARPQFDDASIRLSPPDARGGGGSVLPVGKLVGRNVTLKYLMTVAYSVSSFQIFGDPDLLEAQKYDVDAQAGGPVDTPQIRLMLQSALEDQFKLKVHHETRELPIYSMTRMTTSGDTGPGLVEDRNGDCAAAVTNQNIPPPGTQGPVVACGNVNLYPGANRINGRRGRMVQLADRLSTVLGRTVIDNTGLTGLYNIALTWTSNPVPGGLGPDIFTAIQAQLGLKLESGEGPVEVIVIDSAMKLPHN